MMTRYPYAAAEHSLSSSAVQRSECSVLHCSARSFAFCAVCFVPASSPHMYQSPGSLHGRLCRAWIFAPRRAWLPCTRLRPIFTAPDRAQPASPTSPPPAICGLLQLFLLCMPRCALPGPALHLTCVLLISARGFPAATGANSRPTPLASPLLSDPRICPHLACSHSCSRKPHPLHQLMASASASASASVPAPAPAPGQHQPQHHHHHQHPHHSISITHPMIDCLHACLPLPLR